MVKVSFLLDYYKPYRSIYLIILALTAVQILAQFLILFAVKPFLKVGSQNNDLSMLIMYGAVSIGLVVVYAATSLYVTHLASKTSAKIATDLRRGLFRKTIEVRDIGELGTDTSGLMVHLMTDVDVIQRYTTDFIRVYVYLIMTIVATLIASAILDIYAAFMFLVISIMIVVIATVFGKKEYAYRRELLSIFDRIVFMFRDFVRGGRIRRLFGYMDYDHEKFRVLGKLYADKSDDTRLRVNRLSTSVSLVMGIVIILSFVFGLQIGLYSNLDLTGFMIFVQILIIFHQALKIGPFLIESVPKVTASAERIDTILALKEENGGSEAAPHASGFVVESLSGNEPNIEYGKETSIIGISGSGKSGFIKKIVKFSPVDEGSLLFNGVDICTLDSSSLRKRVAYAGSLALTFEGTIENNIRVWSDNPRISLSDACKAAELKFPYDMDIDRYATNIQESDSYKISIARALMKDADLYVFDDCFTTMDVQTKMNILGNIRSSLKGKTIVFTTCDHTIFDDSEIIAIMDDGHLVKEGPVDDVYESDEFKKLIPGGIE